MSTVDCERHGEQPSVTTKWFQRKPVPELGASLLDNLEPIELEECSVCESEMHDELSGVLEDLAAGRLQWKPARGPRDDT